MQQRVASWAQLIEAGALERVEAEADALEAERRAASAGPEEAAALLEVRARLAAADRGPISDLLRAADEDPEGGGRWLLHAARRLSMLPGRPLCAELLSTAQDLAPTADGARMQAALARDGAVDTDAARARVADALAQGDRGEARRAASSWSDPAGRRVLAQLAAEDGDWVRAAEVRAELARTRPDADERAVDLAASALAFWRAGRRADARQQLGALRDATRERTDGASRTLHDQAVDGLAALSGAEAPAAWLRVDAPADRPVFGSGGRGLLRLLGWARPALATLPTATSRIEHDDHPTAAHLRRRIDAIGARAERRRFDAESLAAALGRGAFVVLEEERPAQTGFVWVRAFEPTAELLEVVDPALPGAVVRRWADQCARGSLFAVSGLAVDDAAADAVSHDPELELLDACDLDEHGDAPPRAKVDALASRGLEQGSSLPMLHRRRGEALLEGIRTGELQPSGSGAFEVWLADAREQFPDAEWPFQLYARALELQGRNLEACIAWRDAALRDPLDYRNVLGEARAFGREGALWATYRSLRQASALAPAAGDVEGMLALNALHRHERAQVRVHARIARALAPQDLRALMASATAAELDREFEDAARMFAQLVERDDVGAWAPARLARRHAEQGRFVQARAVMAKARSRYPADALAWALSAEAALAEADVDEAFELACAGIDRCGASERMLDVAFDAAICGAEDHAPRVAALIDRLMPEPGRVDGVVRRLVALGDEALAVDVARRGASAFGRDLDGAWLLVRSLLRTRRARAEHTAEIVARLDDLLPHCGSFPYPRAFAALEALERGESDRALAVLADADVQRSPVLLWELTARALVAQDKAPAAEALRARMPEAYPAAVLGEAGFLRAYGHAQLAADLLHAMIAHRGEDADASIELARCWSALGEPARAFDVALAVSQGGGHVAPAELASLAHDVARWDTVFACAEQVVRELEVDSTATADVWGWRGVLAAAAAARGDAAPRAALLRAAPQHVRAHRELVRAERAAGVPTAVEDAQRLRALAPGALTGIDGEAWR